MHSTTITPLIILDNGKQIKYKLNILHFEHSRCVLEGAEWHIFFGTLSPPFLATHFYFHRRRRRRHRVGICISA